MDWNEIMEIKDPHKALKAIAYKIDTENFSIAEMEERMCDYARHYNIDTYKMAFYPNGGRVLDPNDVLTIKYEAKKADEDKAQEIRDKMREMEVRGEYYFHEPLHLMPYTALKELYMAAVNYLSDTRTSLDYVGYDGEDCQECFSALTSLIPNLETVEEFGRWVIDKAHKGTVEDSMRAPYIRYHELIDTVFEATRQIIAALPNGNQVQNSEAYLADNGIDYKNIKELDVSEQDEHTILAMIMHVYSYERFCDGYIAHFFRRGYILKWIKRLKEIDEECMGNPEF